MNASTALFDMYLRLFTAQFAGAQDGVLDVWIDALIIILSSWYDFSSDRLACFDAIYCFFPPSTLPDTKFAQHVSSHNITDGETDGEGGLGNQRAGVCLSAEKVDGQKSTEGNFVSCISGHWSNMGRYGLARLSAFSVPPFYLHSGAGLVRTPHQVA